jgi:hypothetical protein
MSGATRQKQGLSIDTLDYQASACKEMAWLLISMLKLGKSTIPALLIANFLT